MDFSKENSCERSPVDKETVLSGGKEPSADNVMQQTSEETSGTDHQNKITSESNEHDTAKPMASQHSLPTSSGTAPQEPKTRSSSVNSEKNISALKEHEPLTHLLTILPSKMQKGLFSTDVEYTCLDATPEYVALGSNMGVVFLYDRLALTLQRLNCQKQEFITCVKLQQSVDYVVAVGTVSGTLFIFQLPSYLPGRNRQLQLFSVQGLHYSTVTTVEWSPNTMRLFSGDVEGNVVCTEMDYATNESRSFLVLQEPHKIIQLGYAHKTLLVSTTFRAVLVYPDEVNRKVRIGQKDRKVLGNFGACFKRGLCKKEDMKLFAARPGLRLWKAGVSGVVEATYIFKDRLNEATPVITVLPDTVGKGSGIKIDEKSFGRLCMLDEEHIISWHDHAMFVLDPRIGVIIGWHHNLGEIQDIGVSEGEIFILRKGSRRRIIRIAAEKDPLNETDLYPPASPTTRPHGHLTPVTPPASPVQIIQQTANLMSVGLKDVMREVGEKIQAVQDGHRPGQLPPWGVAPSLRRDSEDSPDIDSCKEVSSQSSTSDVGSPTQPVIAQTDDLISVTLPESQSVSSDLPSDATLQSECSHTTEISTETETAGEPESEPSRMVANAPEKPIETTVTVCPQNNSVEKSEVAGAEGDDIVFSSVQKKTKKKRSKQVRSADLEQVLQDVTVMAGSLSDMTLSDRKKQLVTSDLVDNPFIEQSRSSTPAKQVWQHAAETKSREHGTQSIVTSSKTNTTKKSQSKNEAKIEQSDREKSPLRDHNSNNQKAERGECSIDKEDLLKPSGNVEVHPEACTSELRLSKINKTEERNMESDETVISHTGNNMSCTQHHSAELVSPLDDKGNCEDSSHHGDTILHSSEKAKKKKVPTATLR